MNARHFIDAEEGLAWGGYRIAIDSANILDFHLLFRVWTFIEPIASPVRLQFALGKDTSDLPLRDALYDTQGFWLALFKSLMLYDLNRFDRISSHGFDGLGEVAVAGTA